MKRLVIFFYFFSTISIYAQDFKVVGYLPYYRFDLVEEIDFTKITHLNLAFLNPDIEGNLSIGGKNINPIISHAKDDNPHLEIFISLAGGGVTEEWAQAYDKFLLPENRSEFAHLLVAYVLEHDLDGIDVDLEWGYVNEYYSPFVLVLADTLKSHGKQISAALPGTHRYSELSDKAMNTYDFLNLMAYDLTGPWAPDNPGPHSPRAFAVQSINYWRNQGLQDAKMTLGVPFYGWDFTDLSNIKAFTFSAMVNESEHYAYADQVGERYYNGIPTIQYKTLHAIKEGIAGVMIWELGQDSFDNNHQYSLLSALDFVVQTGTVPITGIDENLFAGINFFPNPFHDKLTISSGNKLNDVTIRLFDLQGRAFFSHRYSPLENELSIDFSQLNEGIYVMKVDVNGNNLSRKIIKIN